MKSANKYVRPSISFFISLAVTTVFTLQSFAAPEISRLDADPKPFQDCSGLLTVKSGKVTINGNEARTGATVLSGSIIATNSDGEAIIDLGALGRVVVGDDTTVTLTCGAGLLGIRSDCRTEIEVRKGTVDIKEPKIETLVAGKEETYDGVVVLSATDGVDVKVECDDDEAAYISFGLVGLLALIGVAASVAVGIKLGEDDIMPPSSPIR
jgi:hypothetical protein